MSYVWGILSFLLFIISLIMFIALINPTWINKRLKENQKHITRKTALACWLIFGFIGAILGGIAAPSVPDKGTLASPANAPTSSPKPLSSPKLTNPPKATETPKVTATATSTPKPTSTPIAAQDPKTIATDVFHKEFGKTNSYDKKDSIVEVDYQKEDGSLAVEVFGQDNITDKLVKEGMWMDSTNVLKDLKDNTEIKDIIILIAMPLTDAYGNKSTTVVMKMTFTNETRQKINWDNFLWDNVPNIAESYWEHPVIAKINTN